MCLSAYACVVLNSYPEGAVGHIDLSPADDDGVFDGLDWGVHTQVGAIPFVCDFNVDGAAFSILSRSNSTSAQNLSLITQVLHGETLQTCA